MMTYQQPSSRQRGQEIEVKGRQEEQIHTLPPRKPERIEVTISNYTKKDVVNARRDLNLLK